MILRLKCQEKLFLSIETLLYGVTGIWFLSKVIWAYLYYFDIFLFTINMGTCTIYGILICLAMRAHIVDFALGPYKT
jgi:hypothetical protein